MQQFERCVTWGVPGPRNVTDGCPDTPHDYGTPKILSVIKNPSFGVRNFLRGRKKFLTTAPFFQLSCPTHSVAWRGVAAPGSGRPSVTILGPDTPHDTELRKYCQESRILVSASEISDGRVRNF